MSSPTFPNLTVKDEWIDTCKRGDDRAFAKIVRVWEGSMLQTATRILGSVTEAEEVRQTVLLKIYQQPESIPQADRFAAWIRRCVINEALRRIRRRKVESNYQRDATLAMQRPTGSTDPATIAMQRDESTRLHQAMAGLSPDQRAILSLRFDDGLTIREIADVLKKPRTTVHKQLVEVIQILRREMNRSQGESND